jgi:hypothetical protein
LCGKTFEMKLTEIKYKNGWLYVDITYIPKCLNEKGRLFYNTNKDSRYGEVFEQTEGDFYTWSDTDRFEACKLVVAQSPELSLPNIPYIEVKDDN